MFTSSGLKRNTSENNKNNLNDRLYLDKVKFMLNNPINEDRKIR